MVTGHSPLGLGIELELSCVFLQLSDSHLLIQVGLTSHITSDIAI